METSLVGQRQQPNISPSAGKLTSDSSPVSYIRHLDILTHHYTRLAPFSQIIHLSRVHTGCVQHAECHHTVSDPVWTPLDVYFLQDCCHGLGGRGANLLCLTVFALGSLYPRRRRLCVCLSVSFTWCLKDRSTTLAKILPLHDCGLCGLTVERSLAIQKVAGSNLGRSASR